jgi:hypothetical protein
VFRAIVLNRIATLLGLLMLVTPAWAGTLDDTGTDAPGPDASGARAAAPSPGLSRWFNPANAPFIPVPEIAVDPNSGTTLGILPVIIKTDDEHAIRQIIAPDLLYNPFFGVGFHLRAYAYTSEDEQSSIVTGAKERVEREFDAEYQRGRLREERWSFTGSVIYDRDGTPRFFGVGNNSPEIAETNYTNNQELLQAQIGLNFSRIWQLLYTARMRVVDVLPGTLARIASIESRFANVLGIGTNYEQLNRVSIIYDTRDDLTAPRTGTQWVAYGGLASRHGLLNDSLYSEAGVDGRNFWRIDSDTLLATHVSVRYLPTAHRVPFWALSSLGGGQSVIGGDQQLRGYGPGRFYDRNSFSGTVELRRNVTSFNAVSTHIDLEVAPFVDVGRVFSRTSSFPVAQLHRVGGVGFRGIARPSVVGYVDIGYGNEGVAVFTGINYPF